MYTAPHLGVFSLGALGRRLPGAVGVQRGSCCVQSRPAWHADAVPVPLLSRRTVLGALALPFATGLTGCLGEDWDSLPPTRLTIATGNQGGVFARYGEALGTTLGRRLAGVSTTIRLTAASVENLHLVSDGTADIGFSLGDAASAAVRGSGAFTEPLDVVAVARTYDSFVHLVVQADSPVREVADVRGGRVGVGVPGSGTRLIALRVLERAGVPLESVEVAGDSLVASATALQAGRLDAFFFVSGLPNEAVRSLSEVTPIRLVDLGNLVGPMTRRFGPEYAAGPVPASTYGLPGAVDTVAVKNYVVVHRKMPRDLAYAVTRVMFEAQAEIERLAPGVRQPNLGAAIFTSPLDLHPGSLRYYRERNP